MNRFLFFQEQIRLRLVLKNIILKTQNADYSACMINQSTVSLTKLSQQIQICRHLPIFSKVKAATELNAAKCYIDLQTIFCLPVYACTQQHEGPSQGSNRAFAYFPADTSAQWRCALGLLLALIIFTRHTCCILW